MEPFEVNVDGELFRISERTQPGGALSYDFTWLNGPVDGTYGFTVGQVVAASGESASESASRITREHLVKEAREFVKSFDEPGEIGE